MDGFSVSVNKLFGSRGAEHLIAAKDKVIRSVALVGDDAIRFEFEDGSWLSFRDDGQSCCESRYMVCDDDLPAFVGAKLLGAELRDAPSADEYGEHEIQFLVIETDRGPISVANHNEHNGYYGGFWIKCEGGA